MKYGVIGDVHYGAGYGLGKVDKGSRVNFRLTDFRNTFEYSLQHCYDNGIMEVFVTGDMFEHRIPHPVEYSYLYKSITKYLEMGMIIHIIIGNHDTIRDHLITTVTNLKMLNIKNLYIYEEVASIVRDGVNFYFMPFKNRQSLGVDTDGQALNVLQESLYEHYDKIGKNGNINFVIGHYMFHGTKLNDQEMVHHSYNELKIPLEFFKDFEIVIMGHVHRQHYMRKNPMRFYVGSTDRKDFGEHDHDKGILIYDASTKGHEIVPLPVRSLYEFEYDYSHTTIPKEEIQQTIINRLTKEIDHDISGSIVKFLTTLPHGYKRYFDEKEVGNLLKSHGVKRVVKIESKEINPQRSRIKDISERTNTKSAFKKFVEVDLGNNEVALTKVMEAGMEIIDAVGVK